MPKQFKSDDNIVDMIQGIIRITKEARQRRMSIPTDPREIHRRANAIRAQIEADKEEQREKDQIRKDLDLIRFHNRVTQSHDKPRPSVRLYRLIKEILKP